MSGDSAAAMPASKKPDGPDHPLTVRIEGHRATVPGIIAGAGADAARRFLEFFAASIRNKNTRAAYYKTSKSAPKLWVSSLPSYRRSPKCTL